MSTTDQLRIIHRLETVMADLQTAYKDNNAVTLELKKMHTSLQHLISYLTNLDQLKPNYSTNDIHPLVTAVNLHVDILKEALQKANYQKLANAMKAVKIILRFHPQHYNWLTFTAAWLVEWVYFI